MDNLRIMKPRNGVSVDQRSLVWKLRALDFLNYVEIHYSHSHNNRLFLSCCFFCCSDKANYFNVKQKKWRSCLSRPPINTRRKRQYLSFHLCSQSNKSPFNFNCVDTNSAMGHERRHISSFSIFSTSIFTTKWRSHCIFKFYLFLWKWRWKEKKIMNNRK